MTRDIPTLETNRLILRAPIIEDLEPMCAFFSSERSHLVGGPLNEAEVWGALLRTLGHWYIRGYGFWHIVDKETNKMAGYTGILHHITWPEPELCWGVYNGYEGKSIAYEAASAARMQVAKWGIESPISIIDHNNLRSQTLAKRMGAQLEQDTQFKGHPVFIFRHYQQVEVEVQND